MVQAWSTRGRAVVAAALLTMLLGSGCAERKARRAFIENVETAHGREAWPAQQALAFDVEVQDGLDALVNAHFVCALPGPRVRADFADGTHVVWNGASCRVSSETTDGELACRQVRHWSSLLLAPFRLHARRVHVQTVGELPFRENPQPVARVIYRNPAAAGSPAYLLYTDAADHRVVAEAFVVHEQGDDAKWTPRAVTFEKYENVGGVAVPVEWQFWPWSKADGPRGDLIGYARLSNVQFVPIDDATFTLPAEGEAGREPF